MVRTRAYGILALRRREGPAYRDRAVGVEVAKLEAARFGLLDRCTQGNLRNLLRADTPRAIRLSALRSPV
jgi:hypothetical protein